MNTTAEGAYQVECFEDGELIFDTGEFSNLITDEGLANGSPFESGILCVGTGTAVPTFADVALDNEVAAKTATFSTNSTIFMKGDKRYAKRVVVTSFTGLTANISELGFRGAGASSLRSRTLVRDGNGLVTVIEVKNSQTIKISYFVYVLIPEVMATGTLTTPYGQSVFTVKPHADLVNPMGILAGKFSNPFEGYKIRATIAGGYVDATVSTWTYDSATRTVTGTVNFNAIETNRTFLGFESENSQTSFPIIELDTPLINPAQHDCSFTLSFTWGRAA